MRVRGRASAMYSVTHPTMRPLCDVCTGITHGRLLALQVSGAVQHELLNKNLLYRCLDCVVQVPPPLLRRRRQQCAL